MAFSPSFGSLCGILLLANETLGQIAFHLAPTPGDFNSFMFTCVKFDEVAAPVRYTTLVVEGPPGRRLLASLLSDSSFAVRYRLLVKRIWFRGYHERELYLNTVLLADLLQHTLNVVVLWMESSSLDNEHVVARMRRNGIVRESIHPAFFIDHGDEGPSVPLTLPRLQYYRLSGSPSLISVVHHRSLTELDLAYVLDHDDFASFVSSAEGSILGNGLETLVIKLARAVDVAMAMFCLSNAFPNLRSFSLEKTSLDMKVILELLGCKSPIFPRLKHCWLNKLYTYRLANGSKHPLLAGVNKQQAKDLLSKITTNHRRLEMLGLGHNVFLVGRDGTFDHRVLVLSIDVWSGIFGGQFRPFMKPAAWAFDAATRLFEED